MSNSTESIAISLSQAAQLIGVSRPTIYQYAKRNDFPAFKVGGRVLVSVDGLKAWVNQHAGVN